MSHFVQDLSYAVRMLRKRPWTTAAAVATLALGIGANTAIFSVINGILLTPLPFPQSDRLVALERSFPQGHAPTASVPKFVYWREHSASFQALTAYEGLGSGFNLTGDGRPERLVGSRVSAEFFKVLGIRPALGRDFTADDDLPGAPPVAILSGSLFQRRFGGDPKIVGGTVVLNNRSYQVVGVMPPEFHYLRDLELWTPLQLDVNSREQGHYLLVAGRLKDGVPLSQAQAEMRTVGHNYMAESLGDPESKEATLVRPLAEFLSGDVRLPFLVMMGAVLLVLLIACANVANLQLARASARQREIALRTTLGATRGRIVRQMLTESILLALLGGAAGLLLCAFSLRPLLALSPQPLPRQETVHLDARVLLFTLAIAVLTGLIFGLAPALQARRADPNQTIKDASTGSGAAGGRRGRALRLSLVAAEVALALVPMIVAGLLIKSFLGLRGTDPGFDTRHALSLDLSLAETKYSDPEAIDRLQRDLLPQLEAVPGVTHAAMATTMPMQLGMDLPFTIEGKYVEGTDQGVGDAQYRAVSAQYFQALGIGLVRGRLFTASESATHAPGIAIINEAAARQLWPDGDAVGARITMGAPMVPELGDTIPREVIGIVRDVREAGLEEDPPPVVYIPLPQMAPRLTQMVVAMLPLKLIIRGEGNLEALSTSVRDQVWKYDPDQPVTSSQTLERMVAESIGPQQFLMVLLGILAGLALLLACSGIYSVLAYLVSQRTREIGVRMALGAGTRQVARLVLRQGLSAVLLGIAVGLGVAFAATRVLSSLVFGISTTDPWAFGGVSLLLIAVAAAAILLPARRAAQVNPLVALRYE